MKRFFFAMMLMPVMALAETEVVDGITWTYTIRDGEAQVGADSFSSRAILTSITGTITIPSMLGECPVTSIGDYAFSGCNGLTSVTIPAGVKSIGSSAFAYCRGLTSVTIPLSVMSIGYAAFSYCSVLKSVTIPAGVKSIGGSAFSYCIGLTSVTIPASVTSIGGSVFYRTQFYDSLPDGMVILGSGVLCGFKGQCPQSVTIPDGVMSIGDSAFSSRTGLTSVTIPSSVTNISGSAFSDCTGLTSVTIPSSVKSIGSSAFAYCRGLTSVTIPSGVKRIGDCAFYGCSGLELVTIPSSVTSIGDSAFSDCSGLESVTIPSSVTSIGDSAFSDCSGLESVTIPSSVTSIGDYAFSDCSGLTSVTIPSSVTSIGDYAFSDCSGLTSVTIPDGLTNVGKNAFSGTQFYNNLPNGMVISGSGVLYGFKGECPQSVTIPDGVTSIGDNAFYGCNELISVAIPSSVKSIGNYAFSGCGGLTSVTIPSSVTNIGSSAFSGCGGLTSVTIPSSVTNIGSSAFSGCSRLTSVMIPSSVMNIGSSAFSGCSGLTSVMIPSSVTNIGDYAFLRCSGLTSLTIPSRVKSVGKWAFGECRSLTEVVISLGVESVGQLAFSNCSSLRSIIIPSSVASIGEGAFYSCSGLMSVTISAGVTSIGCYAFYNCGKLAMIMVPSSVKRIGSYAFYGCSGLESVTMPVGVKSIGECVFSGCSGLTSVTIPSGVESVGQSAFSNCSSLRSIIIPSSVTSIGNYAFWGCSGLESVTMPTSMTNIGDHAFLQCSGLRSVTIPSSVTNIGSSAFSGCSGLKTVTIPEGVTSIGNSVFYGCSGLKTVSIREGVRSIGSSAFSGCSGLTSVTIPSSVTSIGDSAFSGCSGLRSVSISPGVASIGVSAFTDCSRLATIVIPPSVTKIAAGAFDGCRRLTSVTIPPCVTKLSDTFADSYEMMQSVVLGERTCIGPDMFSGCVKLKSVMIPTSVETIGGRAFNCCAELTAITIPSTVTNIVSDAFDGCDMIKVVFVEGESQECVKECFGDRVWYQKIGTPINYQWEYVCEDGNATITGVRPAYGDVVVPSSCDGFPVTSIGELAFAGCGGLTSVTIPDCVTNFGYDAFAGCTNLNVFLECNCPENYEGSGITSVRSVEFWCDNLDTYPCANDRIKSVYLGSSCALVIDTDVGAPYAQDAAKTYTQFVGEMELYGSLPEYCRFGIGCNGEVRFLEPDEYSITFRYGWLQIIARVEGEYADRWHLVIGNPAYRGYVGRLEDEWFYQYWNRGPLAERNECRRGDVIAITPQDGVRPLVYYTEYGYQPSEDVEFLDDVYYFYLPRIGNDGYYVPTEYENGQYSGLIVNIEDSGKRSAFYVKPEIDPIYVEYDLGLPAGNVVIKSHQPEYGVRDPWCSEWGDVKPYYDAYMMTDCVCGRCVDYPYYVLHQPGWNIADGWRFVGWKDECGEMFENIDWYSCCEDTVRFEAQYELIQYGLTYVDEKGFVLSNPQEFNVTDAVDLEEPPNVFGWLFLGWFDESENRITNTSQLSAQDHTLTAKWEQIYHEVLFNPGAHGRLRNVKLVKQNIARGERAAVPEIDLASGWRFLGWDGDVTQPITNDVTFTAQYEAIEYKLSFEGLKGAAVDYPTTFTVTNSISLVPLADTDDFRFDFWLVNGEIADVIPVGTAVDTVVVAHWTPFVKLGEGGITGWSGMYDGTEHTVSVSVAEPESYSVSCSRLVSGLPTGSWTSMKDVGTVSVRVTVSAEGYAPISRDVTVDIAARPLSTCTLEASGVANYINGHVTWSKRAYDPVAKTTLSDSRDYSVSFVQTGDFTGRATFTGRGNYTGTENVQTAISITTPFEAVGNTTWYYQQSADRATIVRRGDAIASSLTGAVVIPDTVNGLPVTEIADGAFANCSEVTAFVIPEGVAILGDGVFAGCSALKSVVFLGDAPEAPRTFGGAPAELIVYAMPGSRGWGAPVHDVLPERWPFGDDESLTRVIAWLPEVEITPTTGIRSGRVAVTMNYAGVPGIEREIRYTSDGTDPVAASTLYDKRFSLNVNEKTVVKAAAFCGGYRFGSVSSSTFLTSLEEVIVNEGSGAVVLANDVASPWTYDDAELGCGGKACLRSGAISDNMTSSLTATFEGEGVLTFSWKTACEYDDFGEFFFDHAECLLDGVVVAQADDETDWTDVEIPVSGKGVHSLVWRYVKDDADEDGADYEDCVWLGNVAFSCAENELQPTVVGDEGAVVTGDEEIGFVIRPSGTKTVVEVEIPIGLDAAKVTVEVTVAVTSLKSNGAKVKIVSGGADITEFLDLPSADGEGVIDLSRAAVRSEIVNEVLDPEKGAVIELTPDSPTLTTVNTRPGLVYTLHEGAALDGMTSGDSKVGDGEPWTPDITVKGGNSAFYFISVGK